MQGNSPIIVTSIDDLTRLIETAVCKAMSNNKPSPDNTSVSAADDILIDRKELRRRLGGVTEATVIRWERKGKIPGLRIGDAARYSWPAVMAALQPKKR